jgi:hypothetical protein
MSCDERFPRSQNSRRNRNIASYPWRSVSGISCQDYVGSRTALVPPLDAERLVKVPTTTRAISQGFSQPDRGGRHPPT